ncbi:metalloregulator ArsR/SmtB family transcription factor [Phaeobacter inhibens]|uniref:metalloregulator ArsR/SmtB family transcription factor n=1 Tax=Phaeobacter inhibens TaxID=221822 RepID=UPI0021A58AA6|nr:metalloregulator ArsR/SmtB family transcription factor [Phaeobacter inhibens]
MQAHLEYLVSSIYTIRYITNKLKGEFMSSPDKVFEALASTTRRRILAYLSEGPLTAGAVAERFEMSQPAISKHLSVLETADLIWKKREGQFVNYGMKADNLGGTLAKFMQEVCPPSRALKAERRAEKDKD